MACPVKRSISLTCWKSSGMTNEMAIPLFPARPVRLDAVHVIRRGFGRSKLMMCVMPLTSMPAGRHVGGHEQAYSTPAQARDRPVSRVLIHVAMGAPPPRGPARVQGLAEPVGSAFLVAVKTIALPRPASARWCARRRCLCAASSA